MAELIILIIIIVLKTIRIFECTSRIVYTFSGDHKAAIAPITTCYLTVYGIRIRRRHLSWRTLTYCLDCTRKVL